MTTPASLQSLAGVIYNQEGLARANEYLRTRLIDGTKTLMPFTVGPDTAKPFQPYENVLSMPLSRQMVSRLFMPIPNPRFPTSAMSIVGFECRYVGKDDPSKIRFVKIKDAGTVGEQFMYGIREAVERPHLPLLVVESVLCCETVRQHAGDIVNCIAFCSALKGPRIASLLLGLSDKVLLAYDNDTGGRNAVNDLMSHVENDPLSASFFTPVIFSSNDINKAATTLGLDYLRDVISIHCETSRIKAENGNLR